MLVAGLEQPQDQSMLFFLYCSTLCHILASRASVSTRQQPWRVALGTRMIMPQPLLTLNPNPKETELRKADRTVGLNR